MNEQQQNRISMMNFGEQFLGQDGKQFQMNNNTWVPISPENLILVRSNTVSDWPANQTRRVNYQECPVPGSDYMRDMLLHYSAPDQNLHLIGHSGQTGEHSNFGSNSVERNSAINHIAGSYTQAPQYDSNGLNNSTLELLLKKNSVDRNSVINHTGGSYMQAQQYESNGLNNSTLELLLKKNSVDRNSVINHTGGSYTQVQQYESNGLDNSTLELLLKNNLVERNINHIGGSYTQAQQYESNGLNNSTLELLLKNSSVERSINHIGGSYTQAQQYESNGLNNSTLELLLKKNSVERNINHIGGSYTQAQQYVSNGLNNSTLDLLLKKNATNIATANRNLDASINMAGRNPLLPNIYPQTSSDGSNFYAGNPVLPNLYPQARSDSINSYAGIQRCKSNSASDIVYKEANILLIPNRDFVFNGSSSNNFVNNDIHGSVPNQLKDIFSDIPYGDSYPKHNRNYVPIEEADATASFTNSLQSIPETMDQLKFVENQICMMPDYTIAESTTHEKDLVSFTENEIQQYCDGLLQQIVDSSSAVTSTTHGDQKASISSICDKGCDEGFDLNKTPGQKAPKRKKHRPKVIVEAKPKRNPNPANPRKKRNSVPKNAATPKADVNKDSTAAPRKSCRKALNFDLENSRNESQSLMDFQHHRNEKASDTTTDYNPKEMQSGANKKIDTKSAFLISPQDEFTVEIGNTSIQSETCFENSQNTGELICQNTFQLVPNIPSNSTGAKGSKRKKSNRTSNQHYSARNPLSTSLCQENVQVDGNFEGATLDKGSLRNNKRKRTQKKLNPKVRGKSSRQKMSKDNSQKVGIQGKNGLQSHNNREMPICCIGSIEQKNKGEPCQIHTTLIDDITSRLCALNLNLKESNMSELEGQKALVPYNGCSSIVPHQGSELAKQQIPRPRVDIDPETERTWKLLMGKEGGEDLEGTNKEKEKWWEEERNVFHGRADSFIARMHLVQGDRRFSKWKGSVVDSVIGVFLTQNVSDHLSSSAFMFLAARFPPKPKSSKRTYEVVVTDTLVEEPELCIVNPDDTIISYRRELNQPTYYLDFEVPHHTGELWRDSESSRINESLIKPNNQRLEEEFLSSPDSLDSSITQDTRNRSSSGSNSESEGLNSGREPSKAQFLTSTNSLQIGKTTTFQEFYHSVNGVSLFEEQTEDGKLQQAEHVNQSSRVGRNDSHSFHSTFGHPQKQQLPIAPSTDYELHYSNTQGLNTFQMNGQEFYWAETVSGYGECQDNNYRRSGINEVGHSADKSTKMQYGNRTLGSPELTTMNPYGPSSKHFVLGDAPQSRSQTNYNQHSPDHHLVCQKTLQSESGIYAKSLNTSRISGGQVDAENDHSHILKHAEESLDSEKCISTATRQVCSGNSQAEQKAQKQVYNPGPKDKESKFKVPKARKMKTEAKQKHADDWDKLRRDVQEYGTEKERSEDTMDSLDYEALRCASVQEISEAIKERGMNNMLAERIKDFLNRLVKEHGRVDLEWLRDVPPDKVKDYLLSIRGLGLKSVECVRLLTLHHLAFPVDTNVGRIAVRLGWVPLQPLPETLQIHLLDMYPVLESVQKYLWPRLCKLDQRTLYELHYQMITFGKVFCTKRQPNCNACPMRAECRHFASAFASARLALPGPEEKRIVNMPAPIASEINALVNMNPVILSLLENNMDREETLESGQCEPIIEEPATPEECSEQLERDIEDYFAEDPDELPHINISHDVFAKNLENCMQEYEGDLSKALVVALTTHSASIPTPKLKYVSRLRTEHQVYELPDSHPLLEKMDKREPDDPSPYLLAIWSPGETANSTEPPQRMCESQDSTNMCNDETCFSCNSIREADSQIVRGTLLIPCRTATRGSFPLNGTYFQVNELFADHASSLEPIAIPRSWIWNLPRRKVYFGTSVSAIFRGLTTQEIQHCFWRGFVCVRGFDQQARTPRPLRDRFHFSASRSTKTKQNTTKKVEHVAKRKS